MVSRVKPVPVRQQAATPARQVREAWLLGAGAAAFGIAVALYAIYAAIHPGSWTLDPVDLGVYRSGGLIVRHIRPVFDPRLAAPLYDWGGYGSLGLKFTYTPFAAIVFAVVSCIPWSVLPKLSVGVNIVALVAALWFTFGGLGYRDRPRVRLAATLLASGAVLWTEPVIRTMYLGQVNLVLMALIIWDLCQPDTEASRWWKGAGVGIAAGIKLVPLVYIPYLILTRKFRQAFMVCVGFAFTVLLGFAIQPSDSVKWWFHGLFFQGGRTGFTGWEGNQSLRGIITRFIGSIAGANTDWLIVAALVGILGIVCAAMLDRAGHQMAGLLAAALTGLLLSPISWDHHWVWIAPGVAVAGHYAVRAWRSSRARAWAWWALAGGIVALYGAWPGSLWGEPTDLGPFSLGIIWQPPNTDPATYYKYGDQPWFVEYHWHGIELLTGNAFVLGGLALLALLAVWAWKLWIGVLEGSASSAAPVSLGTPAAGAPGQTAGESTTSASGDTAADDAAGDRAAATGARDSGPQRA
jgi:alpha-1,2-mannosyltransferase